MDIYKLGFMLTQIVALIFLASKVLIRNRLLQVRFLVRVKHRLMQINKLKDINMDVKFDEQEIQQLEALLNEQFEEETRAGSLHGSQFLDALDVSFEQNDKTKNDKKNETD